MTDAIKRTNEAVATIAEDSGCTPEYITHVALTAALSDREGMVTVAGLHDPVPCSRSGDGPTQRWWLCEQCSWESPRSPALVPRDALRHQVDALVAHLIGGEGEALRVVVDTHYCDNCLGFDPASCATREDR